MAGLGLGAAERLAAQSLANIVMDCGSNDSSGTAVSAYDDNDRDGRISSGDRVRLRQEDCDSVTTEILVDVTAATVAGSRVESISGRLDYSRVPVSGSTAAVTVESEGAFELDYRTAAAGSSWSLTGMSVTSAPDGMTDRLTGGVLRSTITNRDFSVEFNGRLQSESLGGSLDFRTETAFSASLGSFPTAGEMRLEAENSAASIAPSTDTMQADQAAWRVDTAGSGQFSDAVSVPWRDWIAGSLFNWYPLIRSLVIEPRRPVTTDSLIAVADIYNPQQRQLSVTFEWRFGIYIADSETLPYFLTDKGPVTLRLSVSDGVTSETLAVTTEILNSPPELDVRLSPETPDTTDDLVAVHQVSDVDLDDVSVSYQWYVNDEAVSGATGGMLRADRHRKADVVRLVVAADDGESTTTVPMTVTIGDAAPRVSATDAPDSVAYGNSVRFSAAVSDPDGDDVSEFRYRLEYGPEGMTVDPVTGRIEWLGKMPMFGPEMTVHWQVGGSSGPAIPSSGTIRLLDSARPYPHVRTSVRAPARARLFVEDFDGDGDDEVLVHDLLRNVYTLEWNGEHYVQTWMHPFPVGEFGIDAVASADIDGDGRHEIFLHAEDRMVRLDGSSRHVGADAKVPPALTFAQDLEVADLDGDGVEEVVGYLDKSLSDPKLEAIRVTTGESLGDWTPLSSFYHHVPWIADVDGDGTPEIFHEAIHGGITAYRYDAGTDEFVQLDRTETRHPGTAFGAGDLDGDGRGEMIWGGERLTSSDWGAYTVAEFDGEFRVEWTQPAEHLIDEIFIGGRAVDDIGMPTDRLMFVTGAPNGNSAHPHSVAPLAVFLSPSSGRASYGPRLDSGYPPMPHSRWYVAEARIADYDLDGTHEILLAMSQHRGTGRLVAFDPFRAVDEWSISGAESVAYPPLSSADINGDGHADLITRTGIYDMVGGTKIWEPESGLLEHAHSMAAGDLDGDGKDEILFVTDGTGDMGVQAVWRLDENGELLNWFPVEEYDLGRQVRLLVLPGAVRKQVVVTYNSFFRLTSRLVAYDPVFGGKIWTSPELLGVVSPDSFHQFDVGGEPRLAIGTTSAMYVTQ